jgi:hypothetical protein
LSKSSFRAAGLSAAVAFVAMGFLSAGIPSVAFAEGPKQTLGDLVRAGKRESVLAAITSPDVDVNETAPDGSTALMWATFTEECSAICAQRTVAAASVRVDVVLPSPGSASLRGPTYPRVRARTASATNS